MSDGSVTVKIHTSTVDLSRRIIRDYLRGQWKQIAVAVICMIIVAGSTGAQAKLVEPALDKLRCGERSTALGNPLWISYCSYRERLWELRPDRPNAKGRPAYDRHDAGSDVQLHRRADLAYIQQHATGRQMTRFTNDVQPCATPS